MANAYWQVPELRGFEKFCIGRSVDELNKLTSRLCGVCPGAHHLCATKALDGVFGVEPTETARKLRELFYSAHYIHSHIAHFYALAAATSSSRRSPGRSEEHPRRGPVRSEWRSEERS